MRAVATRDPRPSTFTAGYPRPVAPQRHRERGDVVPQSITHDGSYGGCRPRAETPATIYWSPAPDDGPSWPQEWTAWLAMTATALGILGLAYVAAVLAFVAGPGR